MFPSEATTAEAFAKAMFQFIGRYGIPMTIRTDRGSDFSSEIANQMNILSGIDHKFTFAYSKEENAIVERSNKEIMRHLRAIFLEGGISELFYEDLWIVQRIINSSTHSSIGVSPSTLLFGEVIDLDRRILHKEESSLINKEMNQWLKDRLQHQDLLLKAAIKYQSEIDITNLGKRNPMELSHFPIGTYVLAKNPSSRMGSEPSSKLESYWQGPYQVKSINNSIYIVRDLISDDEYSFHIKNLKPFQYDELYIDPTDVVIKESQQIIVDSVIEHRIIENGNPNHIRDYEFLLHWKNKDERFDQWTPWKEVRSNSIVHQYLKNNHMGNKIPKAFK